MRPKKRNVISVSLSDEALRALQARQLELRYRKMSHYVQCLLEQDYMMRPSHVRKAVDQNAMECLP
jgi:hypothetical protein